MEIVLRKAQGLTQFVCVMLLLCSSCTSRAQQLPAGLELPAITDNSTIVKHAGYTASFNSDLMIPNWVAYILTDDELSGTVRRPSNSPFQPDPDYKGRQPERRDYSNTGWDKGHLAPCADMKWSEQAMIESFYFTNVCPQDHDFNGGDWEQLEDLARRIARKKGALCIVCGPIVSDNACGKLGQNKVTIPDSFFKAFLYQDSDGYHSIAYLIPNKQTGQPLSKYALSVNNLEALLGLDLFTHLDSSVQEAVESQTVLSDWR